MLPVVTDQFATVTVVPNEEIRRAGGATLGDLLFSKPGITGSSFAPGASSRPIIRGLDVNRVGIVENGIGSNGASDLGEDHFVPIDPLVDQPGRSDPRTCDAALRIDRDRRRGQRDQQPHSRRPAVLRGGAVPELRASRQGAAGECAVAGLRDRGNAHRGQFGRSRRRRRHAARCRRRQFCGSCRRLRPQGQRLQHSRAIRICSTRPGRSTAASRIPPRRPTAASIGGSYIFDGGFIGAAITQNNSLYRIPGIDGADHLTRIDARQTKFTAKGEYRPDAAAIEAIRFWAGATDYKHNEIGLADSADPTTLGVRQTFTNKEQEGRVEVQLTPFNVRFAALTTAVGVQAWHQKLTAPSPDDPGSPLNGLLDPNKNTKVAGYVFNELKFSDTTKAQVAGRIERANLSGTTPAFIPEVFDLTVDPAAIGPATARNLQLHAEERQHRPDPESAMGSGREHHRPICRARAQAGRAVFARRARCDRHVRYRQSQSRHRNRKIGRGRLAAGDRPVAVRITGYYTKFNGFIFRRLTGNTCEDGVCQIGPGLELNQAIYSQRDATFRGGEFQSQYDVLPVWNGMFGIERQYDIVRATFDDGTNVPRIPPLRLGGGVFWRDANWLARVNLLHAFAQNDIAVIGETPTAGYNLLKAEISYKTKLDASWFGAREMTVGLVGNNLLNENIRNHVSYTKDEVLLPGIGVRAFANLKF